MEKRKVIYYEDELNDEFSLAKITPKKIDGDYIYCYDSLLKRLTHFFWYRIVATPIAFLYTKLKFAHKCIGKEKLKEFKNKPYFLFGNHTQDIGDAFIPNIINFPKTNYVIVHPNNVSMPFLGRVTPSMGALPLPDDIKACRNFNRAIDRRLKEGHSIVVYPEGHIWPYYINIRNFTDGSFQFPVKYGAPVFCFTNTYQKRILSKKPRIVSYIDGPFYPQTELPPRERKKELRDRVYKTMCERAKKSCVESIKYIKRTSALKNETTENKGKKFTTEKKND